MRQLLGSGLYRVKFTKYKQKEDIDIENMILRKDNSDEGEISEKAFIPESLRILPTDTAKVHSGTAPS